MLRILRYLLRLIHRPRPRPTTILWKRDGGWGEERPVECKKFEIRRH